MSTIIQAGGSATVTVLASLTNIPTSNTAVSGTENWQKYDAIYFECLMHYSDDSNKSVFTNLILTDTVSTGQRYTPLRVSDAGGQGAEANIFCYFSQNVITILKFASTYDVTKVSIYGVNF